MQLARPLGAVISSQAQESLSSSPEAANGVDYQRSPLSLLIGLLTLEVQYQKLLVALMSASKQGFSGCSMTLNMFHPASNGFGFQA